MKDNTHQAHTQSSQQGEYGMMITTPNDSRGPWGPKISWHLSEGWGKTPKKPHPGNLSRPGIEPGPAAWQGRMLPLAPQRWTKYQLIYLIYKSNSYYIPTCWVALFRIVNACITFWESWVEIRESTAVEQVAACTPVTQRAQVRSPVGTSFLREVFSGFFFTCKTNVRKL